MRTAIERGEMAELQDTLNREVFTDPRPIEDGDVVIGLMWVYAIKSNAGKYDPVKGRITLMGNQEKLQALIGRVDAYAPVAQMVLIAQHIGIVGMSRTRT